MVVRDCSNKNIRLLGSKKYSLHFVTSCTDLRNLFKWEAREDFLLQQLAEVVPRQRATCGPKVGDGSPVHLFFKTINLFLISNIENLMY